MAHNNFVPSYPSPLSVPVEARRQAESGRSDTSSTSQAPQTSHTQSDPIPHIRPDTHSPNLRLDPNSLIPSKPETPSLQNPFEYDSFVGEYPDSDSNPDSNDSLYDDDSDSPLSLTTNDEHPKDSTENYDDINYDDIDYDSQAPDNSFIANNLELNNFPLFKKAPKSFYNKIISHLKLIQYHPSNFIIKKGAPSKSMYWILKGTVCITSPDGDSIYNELTSGQFFGEIGILFNRPRTANVVAKTKVLLGVLTSKDFNIVLKSFPLMERRIRDEAQERLAMLDKKSKHIKEHNAKTDQKSSKRYAPVDTSQSFPLPLAQPSAPTGNSSSHDKVDATISIQQFIKNLPIFESLPPSIIHKLALGAEPLTYQPFNYLFYENDVGADIYFIVSGQVEVIKYDPQKKRDHIIAKLNNGNYFGEMSFLSYLSNKPMFTRSATVRSITNLELIVIRSQFLKKLCTQYPFIIDHMKYTSEVRNNENHYLTPGIPHGVTRGSDDSIDLKNFKLDFTFRPLHSRSVSPSAKGMAPGAGAGTSSSTNNTSDENVYPKSRSQNQSPVSNNTSNSSNTPAVAPTAHGTIVNPRPKLLKRSISLNLTPQSTLPSSTFSPPPSDFDYIPHNKRVRLNSVGRRRSSVLAINSHLSDKTLLKIFEYLDLPTLMKLRIICKRWRQLLSLCTNLFETLDLRPWNTSLDDKSLIDIVKFVGSRPNYIDISNCFHITDEGFSYMVNEIGISGKIKCLKMRSNWEISAMAIMDLTAPSVGKNLQEIDLSNCRKVRDNVLERLIGWNNPADKADLGYDDYEHEYDEDIGCKNLTTIKVGYCKHLTDRIMHHISENCNERLTELDLTRCTTITDKGFEYWTYKFFPNLTTLSLKDCTFLTDKSIISLTNSVPNLKSLNLNFCCSLTDISVEVLSIGCQQLEVLDLSFCGSAVSDSSLLAISMNLNLLQRLTLKGCIRVTRAGIDSLLSSNSALNYLDVGQCKNSDFYPGAIPAQKLNVNPQTKSAFVTAGHSNKIIEIVI